MSNFIKNTWEFYILFQEIIIKFKYIFLPLAEFDLF
jgi:hypothetical protein